MIVSLVFDTNIPLFHYYYCVFLDLAKAFDSVSHPRLVLKLEALGISGDILNWLRVFLTGRRQ